MINYMNSLNGPLYESTISYPIVIALNLSDYSVRNHSA
jgi:hypothetical protein